MTDIGRFFWADYLVFGLVMGVSAMVGVFFGIKDRHNMDTEQFLMAGRDMNVFPVAVSLFVSWTSTISLLGDPVECYTYGAVYSMHIIGYTLAIPVTAHFFAPFFQRMKIISAYEFLKVRYSANMQYLGTASALVSTAFWMSFAIYAAGIALTQASGMQLHWALIIIGAVCTFYTSIGGMAAVLWADTLQMLIMVAGQIAIIALGIRRVGGIQQVWQIAERGGRLNLNTDNLNFSLLSRTSILAFTVGGFFRVFNTLSSNQLFVQRYGTVKTARKAKIVVYLTMPMFICLVTVMTLSGLIMYAVYHDCDPLAAGIIQRRDQMTPLMMIDLLGFMPGLPGLFMAALFSAALSTMSSGINAMAALMLKDVTQPAYRKITKRELSDNTSAHLVKIFAVGAGVCVTGLAFLPSAIGETLFGMSSRLLGLFDSPLAGIFFVAVLLPCINTFAVLMGFVITLLVTLWMAVGSFLVPQHKDIYVLPMETYGCPINQTDWTTITPSTNITTTDMPADNRSGGFTDVYRVAHIHFFTFGMVGTVIIAIIIHLLSVCWSRIRPRRGDYMCKDTAGGSGHIAADRVMAVFREVESREASAREAPLMWNNHRVPDTDDTMRANRHARSYAL